MPTETLILVVVISAIFAVFAGALAWADFYTRGLRKSWTGEFTEIRIVLPRKATTPTKPGAPT